MRIYSLADPFIYLEYLEAKSVVLYENKYGCNLN